MARKNIELGVIPTGQGGDTFRSAMIKVNDMTAELFMDRGGAGGGAELVFHAKVFTGHGHLPPHAGSNPSGDGTHASLDGVAAVD